MSKVLNETLKVLKERRSVKRYTDKKVEKEVLKEILEAGTFAANGRGAQSSSIIAIQNKEIIEKLENLNAEFLNHSPAAIKPFYNAPTVVVVLGDSTKNTYIEDGSLVLGNIMNAAYSVGVDSCWINRAKEVFKTPEGLAYLKEWGFGEEYVGIGFCILGYRDNVNPIAKPRKENFIKYVF